MNSRKSHFLVRIPRSFARALPLVLGVLVLLGGPAGPAIAGPSLLVTSQLDHTVKEYDGTTGAFIRNAATGAGQPSGLGDPLDAIIGADGNLLVTDGQQSAIKRFDWATGNFLGIFASPVSPTGMTSFGGKVYVCQSNPPQIVRSFDAVTGADVGSFIPTVGEGNPGPRDVKVANGRLYVSYWNLGTVEMFDLTTRESLGLLFPQGTGGLATPSSMAFGPNGNLYISYVFFVNRYHPTTGEFLGQFVDTGDRTGARYAVGIAWGPDGNLYVATQNTAGVQRYNGTTGAFMDDFVPPGSGGLTAPFHISFTPLPAGLEVGVELEPSVLNLKSHGRWVTAHIEPNGFEPTSIDISTVRLAGSVSAETKFAVVGDHDRDELPDLMLKFSRAALEPLLTPGVNALVLTGSLMTGESFSGTDEVRVINPPDDHPTASVAPNPLNPAGVLTLRTTSQGSVTMKMFDLQGRLVRTLMETQILPAGLHEVGIDGRGERGEVLASGVYYYRVETSEGVVTGRVAILK